MSNVKEKKDVDYAEQAVPEEGRKGFVTMFMIMLGFTFFSASMWVGQEIAHVSQPTVIRFARKLGFGGYRELRYVLRHPAAEHKVTFNPLAGVDLNPWDGEDEIPGKAAYGAKALIDELHSALDPKARSARHPLPDRSALPE